MNSPLRLPAASSRVPRQSRSPYSQPRRLWRLAHKELREILRDRRTIVTLVLMPLLAYPLLSIAFQQFVFSTAAGVEREWYVGMESKTAAQTFLHHMQTGDELVRQIQAGDEGDDRPAASGSPLEEQVARHLGSATDLGMLRLEDMQILDPDDLEAAVQEGRIDLAVRRRELTPERNSEALGAKKNGAGGQVAALVEFDLLFRSGSQRGRNAAHFVERRLWAVNEHFARERHPDGPEGLPRLARWSMQAVASSATSSQFLLATLTPLVLILMTITGAVYPAIDLTAGERERGTLEALMATPVPKTAVLFAKYIAVLAVAILTAAVNLIAMATTIAATGLGAILWGDQPPSPMVVFEVFGLMVLFSAFFSAILLVLTSVARSFKEAQSYLIPLMLIAIGPGFITLMPGLELNSVLCVVPLVNIVLLARDALQGQTEPLLAGAVVVATGLYALAALAVAARVFGADSVLYGSQAAWSDLLRPDPKPVPTIAGAAVSVALLFPLHMILSGLLAAFAPDELEGRLLASAGMTVVLFAAFPWLMSLAQSIRLQTGFQVRRPGPLAWLGAALLGVSLWPFAHELVVWANVWGLSRLPTEHMAGVEELLARLQQASPWLILIALAIVPGICEEWFFRGYLLAACRGRMSAGAAIGLSAVLFGLFHVFVGSGLAGVRFLPSTALGLALAYVCWTTRSVIPGMLLHSFHNGLLLMAAHYQDELRNLGVGIEQREHLPAAWLVAAGAAVVIGFLLIRAGAGERMRERSDG